MTPRPVVVSLWPGRALCRVSDPDPTPTDLNAIATAWLPWNDGVKPTVRVLGASHRCGGGMGVMAPDTTIVVADMQTGPLVLGVVPYPPLTPDVLASPR